jgi:hypothetical protein
MFFDKLRYPLKARGIWCVWGPPYHGKTIFMNFAAKELTQILNKDALTTFESKYSKRLMNLGELNYIEYVEDAHTFIGLDDLVAWCDCRNANRNAVSTWIFNKYRKKGLFIMYSEQVLGSVDFRLGNLTDIFIRPFPIKFPYFYIVGTYPDMVTLAFKPFMIKYGPDVYDTYKTLEIVEMRIKYADLKDLYARAGEMNIFRVFCHGKFGFTKETTETIYRLLKKDNTDLLNEYMDNLGYTLIMGSDPKKGPSEKP